MKTLALVLALSSVALAKTCEPGWTKTPEGVCQEGSSVGVDQSKWVSDEKPPSDKMPSYQREGVKVIDAPNMGESDRKFDESVAREMSTVGKKGSK